MPAPLAVALRPDQIQEREQVRDHDPTPYMREKAAAILKVAAGQSLRAVARSGLLRPRRRETIATWVRRYLAAGPAGLRVRPGRGTNKLRRIAACLEAATGRVLVWQRHRFDRGTLRRSYHAVVAAYPNAETIFLAQDNWPVPFHPELLARLPPPLVLLPLPTDAPWTHPVEKLWRALTGAVLHHHDFGDDWEGLQAAVTTWLVGWADGSPELLHLVGLCPDH